MPHPHNYPFLHIIQTLPIQHLNLPNIEGKIFWCCSMPASPLTPALESLLPHSRWIASNTGISPSVRKWDRKWKKNTLWADKQVLTWTIGTQVCWDLWSCPSWRTKSWDIFPLPHPHSWLIAVPLHAKRPPPRVKLPESAAKSVRVTTSALSIALKPYLFCVRTTAPLAIVCTFGETVFHLCREKPRCSLLCFSPVCLLYCHTTITWT